MSTPIEDLAEELIARDGKTAYLLAAAISSRVKAQSWDAWVRELGTAIKDKLENTREAQIQKELDKKKPKIIGELGLSSDSVAALSFKVERIRNCTYPKYNIIIYMNWATAHEKKQKIYSAVNDFVKEKIFPNRDAQFIVNVEVVE